MTIRVKRLKLDTWPIGNPTPWCRKHRTGVEEGKAGLLKQCKRCKYRLSCLTRPEKEENWHDLGSTTVKYKDLYLRKYPVFDRARDKAGAEIIYNGQKKGKNKR